MGQRGNAEKPENGQRSKRNCQDTLPRADDEVGVLRSAIGWSMNGSIKEWLPKPTAGGVIRLDHPSFH